MMSGTSAGGLVKLPGRESRGDAGSNPVSQYFFVNFFSSFCVCTVVLITSCSGSANIPDCLKPE